MTPEQEKEFLKLHYEPEHEKGGGCWCEVRNIVKDGVLHVEHNEQRILLKAFINRLLTQQKEEVGAFLENILNGIDIADRQTGNVGGGTKAIRMALIARGLLSQEKDVSGKE